MIANLRTTHVIGVMGVLATLLMMLPMAASNYQLQVATEMLIFALLALAINLLAGYAGRTSLCHGAIFGVATYVVVYLQASQSASLVASVVMGLVASAVLSLVFGLLAIRTRGVYFLLLTIALGMMVWGVCVRWTSITGGENGLRADVRPAALQLASSFYYLVLGTFAVLVAIYARIVSSPFGLAIRGIKDSEDRMRSLGYAVTWHLVATFVISGCFAGAAGVLYALFNNFVSPTAVGLSMSVQGLLMVIVGGVGTVLGPIVGSVLVVAMSNIVSIYTDRWSMVIGITFILVMIFSPEGITHLLQRRLRRGTHR
ncbi:MAG: branched-chain amino acid ABC transporter permease [Polaromonas sp.]|nr:branched-chain amino acid ABC transporter permease [Polaromonas sp.]